MNSIKDRLHNEKPCLEISDNLIVDVEKATETIIDVATYADENLSKYDNLEKFTKDDYKEMKKHIYKVYSLLVKDKEQYDKLVKIADELPLQDKLVIMSALIQTAKLEDVDADENSFRE